MLHCMAMQQGASPKNGPALCMQYASHYLQLTVRVVVPAGDRLPAAMLLGALRLTPFYTPSLPPRLHEACDICR